MTMRIRRCPYCSYAVARSRRRGLVETIGLPQILLRPFRCLKCYRRHYGFVFARRSSSKANQSQTVRASWTWVTQHAHLLTLFMCVPLVLAGTRVPPWSVALQRSWSPEVSNEVSEAGKPVAGAAMPVVLRPQGEVVEPHDISNTKDTIGEAGIRELNESTLASFVAQQPTRRPLGALRATGEVYINN